jgi:hypothetical protein
MKFRFDKRRWYDVAWGGLLFILYMSTGYADVLPTLVSEDSSYSTQHVYNLWFSPGIVSYHFSQSNRHRDHNWGYGIESNLSDHYSVTAGNFINSKDHRSNYAGLIWQPLIWHYVKAGFELGVLDGYPDIKGGEAFAVVMPCITIRSERVGVNITLVPYYSNTMHSSAISAQLIVRVW